MINTNLYSKPHHPEVESARNLGIGAVVCIGLVFVCGIPTSIIGIILGFMASSRAQKVMTDFHASPGTYHIETLKKAETARTMGMIGGYGGIIISLLWFFFIGFIIIVNVLENQ
jgi:hypothetical protein